ncbi:MAG: hypothetical protein PHN72_00165 [Bacilli bacterium]|nr:hypothetical protein [Bacilli bacterium]
MNYIYDILLDLKPILYDFYEWDPIDEITHIRRIPIIKVSRECLQHLKENKIRVDSSFINEYRYKAEVFQRKTVKTLECAVIFTDGHEAFGASFYKNEMNLKSRLLLDEEDDVLEISKPLEEKKFDYEILEKNVGNPFRTKKEEEKERYIMKEMKHVKNKEKLEYIYFECFNEKPEEKDNIIRKICSELETKFDSVSDTIYHVLKLTSAKK